MLVVAIGIVLGGTTARILLGGPRGPGSKAWIKRCDYHKSRGDPAALSSHQVATSSLSAHPTTMRLLSLVGDDIRETLAAMTYGRHWRHRVAVILGRGRVTCLRRSADKGFGGSDVFTAEVAPDSL